MTMRYSARKPHYKGEWPSRAVVVTETLQVPAAVQPAAHSDRQEPGRQDYTTDASVEVEPPPLSPTTLGRLRKIIPYQLRKINWPTSC